MSTNFYLRPIPSECSCCGRAFEELHIGLSSGGWPFALHVIPERNLNTLEDWEKLWKDTKKWAIFDEYRRTLSPEQMGIWVRNENPIFERPVDGHHCIGHGPGPWDYIQGDFS